MAQGKLFAEAAHQPVLRRMRLIRDKDRPELRRRVAIAIFLPSERPIGSVSRRPSAVVGLLF